MPKCVYYKKCRKALKGHFRCMRNKKIKPEKSCRNCYDFCPTLLSRFFMWLFGR